MIYDQIKNLSSYRQILPGIAAVESFLRDTDILTLEAGKIQLGGGVVCNVNRYEPKAESKWEAHRNYIDLQYVVRGLIIILAVAIDVRKYIAKK